MSENQLTPEQVAANKAAEQAAKAEEKARIAAEKKAAKELAAAEKKAEKEAAKAAEKAAKAAVKMPEQNGVRRPRPGGLCAKAWEIADSISQKLGSPAPVADVLEVAIAEGLNPGNVKAEYARWRKFHGVTGRIVRPKAETPAEATAETPAA